jgi:hypothetical protein
MQSRCVSPPRRQTGAAGKEQVILEHLKKVVLAVGVNIRAEIRSTLNWRIWLTTGFLDWKSTLSPSRRWRKITGYSNAQ